MPSLAECLRSVVLPCQFIMTLINLLVWAIIHDVTLHTGSILRGAGQLMPPTRRSWFAADPSLLLLFLARWRPCAVFRFLMTLINLLVWAFMQGSS